MQGVVLWQGGISVSHLAAQIDGLLFEVRKFDRRHCLRKSLEKFAQSQSLS
jgi:hypothetical protein